MGGNVQLYAPAVLLSVKEHVLSRKLMRPQRLSARLAEEKTLVLLPGIERHAKSPFLISFATKFYFFVLIFIEVFKILQYTQLFVAVTNHRLLYFCLSSIQTQLQFNLLFYVVLNISL